MHILFLPVGLQKIMGSFLRQSKSEICIIARWLSIFPLEKAVKLTFNSKISTTYGKVGKYRYTHFLIITLYANNISEKLRFIIQCTQTAHIMWITTIMIRDKTLPYFECFFPSTER
ncbi:hypothetical protein PPYR_09477 [Photinus pyralis]|uniref:Uncharacterized protein n=1 Tax=Photinus pyralis TaxID=7054 RepID=A0A5N4AME7_PHOPY|nr:hypothetical protein PPYR_09477 [Photinus pyralis]